MNTKQLNRQIDLHISGLKVREAVEGEGSRTIEGYAVVFGVRSGNLVPWSSYREVYEVMEPGCITSMLLSRSDVVLTAFHDNTAILGRWRMGKGTLDLSLDSRGMRFSCNLAVTERANELLSAINRGDISGMSFAFTADEEDSENGVFYEKIEDRNAEGKEVWLRHVKKVTGLYDVTIAGHPAYEQTTVDTREVDGFLDTKIGEPAEIIKQREAEARRKAEEDEQRRQEKERQEAEERERVRIDMQRRERVMRANAIMMEETL